MILEPTVLEPDKAIMGMEDVNRTLTEIRERLTKIETHVGLHEEGRKDNALEFRRLDEKYDKRVGKLEQAHWKALGILAAGAVMVNWLWPLVQKMIKP